jgi:hypothetical protein
MAPNANRPPAFCQRDVRPAQLEIDDVAALPVDRADGGYFLPRDAPRHQPTVQNSTLVDREHDGLNGGTPTETVHEHGNDQEPGQAKPFPDRARKRETYSRRHRRAEKKERGEAELASAP